MEDFLPKIDTILSIVDGDTFKVNLSNLADTGCPKILCQGILIRVKGIDAPEFSSGWPRKNRCIKDIKGKKEKEACPATNYLRRVLRDAQHVELKNPERGGKHFRMLADVFVDGRRLADLMLQCKPCKVEVYEP